jgi:hypothetical protein
MTANTCMFAPSDDNHFVILHPEGCLHPITQTPNSGALNEFILQQASIV